MSVDLPGQARVRRLVGWPVFILTIAGLAILLYRNWDDFVAAFTGANWVLLVAAALVLTAGHGLSSVLSSRLTEVDGARIPISTAFRILAIGGLSKYVPGGVWEFISRYGLAKSAGMTFRESLGLWLYPTLLILTVSGVWASLAAAFVGYELPWWLFIAGAVAFAVLSTPRPRDWIFSKMKMPGRPPGSTLGWLGSIGIATAGVALAASAGLLVLEAIEPDAGVGLVGATAAFVGSWVIGFVVLPIPGGFGIREGALVLALSPWLDPGSAIAVAALSRIASVASDLIAAGIAVVIGATNER